MLVPPLKTPQLLEYIQASQEGLAYYASPRQGIHTRKCIRWGMQRCANPAAPSPKHNSATCMHSHCALRLEQ